MRKLGLALLIAVAPVGAISAQTVPCSFSGTGATGADCLGQSWQLQGGGWGIPGIGNGVRPFLGTSAATEFHISFIAQGTFDGQIGFGSTVFNVSPFTVANVWTVSGSGNSVSFFAPPATALAPLQDFLVNVQFLNGLPTDLNDVSFTASWGPPPSDVVPEPATMALLATGLAGMAAARRRRKA